MIDKDPTEGEPLSPKNTSIPFAKMTFKQRVKSLTILLGMLWQNFKALANGTIDLNE